LRLLSPRHAEPAGGGRVAPWGDEHVDDLAERVDRPVDIAPAPGDLHIRLVDLPSVADTLTAGSGGIGQQRREPLHPPVDGDVVDLDAAFGEQLLDISVRQAKAEVPANRQHDHIGREAEASERRPCDGSGAGMAGSHGGSLPAPDSITAAATVLFGPTPHFLEGDRPLDVTVLLHWALFVLRAHGVPSGEWLGAQFSFCSASARE
jgi:hypothetical protein